MRLMLASARAEPAESEELDVVSGVAASLVAWLDVHARYAEPELREDLLFARRQMALHGRGRIHPLLCITHQRIHGDECSAGKDKPECFDRNVGRKGNWHDAPQPATGARAGRR